MEMELIIERLRAVAVADVSEADVQGAVSRYRVESMLVRMLAEGPPVRARRRQGQDPSGRPVSESRKQAAWEGWLADRDAFRAGCAADPMPIVASLGEPAAGRADVRRWW